MNVKQLFSFTMIGLLSLVLNACGFHLRESVPLPENLQATTVQGVAEYSNLDLSLKRAFRQAGYPLTTSANARAVLQVTKNSFTRRVLSVNSAGVANEYELKYTLGFKLLGTDKQSLLPEQTITLYRSYRYNPDIVLAKTAEEERLQQNMTDYAVKQLLRRITAKRKTPAQPGSSSPGVNN